MKTTSSALDCRSALVERESELQALGAVMKHATTDGQLLEPRLTRAAPGDRDALLAGAAAPAAGVLCLAGGDQELVRSELSRSLHALFWLVANLAERQPLVLAVDDGQWADATSLEFLAYLARRLEGLPVLIAVTASPAPSSCRPAGGRAHANSRRRS